VLLVAGGLMASNMGFKLNYQLLGTASSGSGTNSLALPYNQQTNLLDAKNLIDDINAAAGTTAVVQVARFLSASDGTESYTGTSGTAFPLTPGEGYQVQVSQDVNYIIVGSHAPTLGVVLNGTATSGSGTNSYAYPYHATAGDAKDLIDEINAAVGSTVVVQVARFLSASDGTESYTGTSGTAFPLVAGQGYQVQVSTTVTYIPSHY
jgi:uncharacterized protein YaiE (UPF0345 family)